MSSVKCPECNLTNWSTAINCKRCGYFLQSVEADSPITELPPPDSFEKQNSVDKNYPANFENPANQTSHSEPSPLNDWSPNPQFNQGYSQTNYQSYYQQPAKQKSGLAIASLVLGLIGCFFTSPIGLVLGIVSLVKANRNPREYGGKGLAIAGIVLNSIGLLFLPIIAAIAIPNLLASRRAANEGSAISTMRAIADSEMKYMSSVPGKCGDLQTLAATKLIDLNLADGEKNGYRFMVVNLPTYHGGCEILATPVSKTSGTRSFYYSTDDGLLRGGAKNGLPADYNDFPVKNDYSEKTSQPPPPQNNLANESAAIFQLRTLQSAEATYAATAGQGDAGELQTLALQGLIKQDLADGEDAGYRFKVVKFPQRNWDIYATPISVSSNNRSFYMGQDGVIHGAAKNGQLADKNDPPLN